MESSDYERLNLGKGLRDLRDGNESFQVMLREARTTLDREKHVLLSLKPIKSSQFTLEYLLGRYQVMQEFLDWIDDAIHDGEVEAEKLRQELNLTAIP